MWEAGKKCNTMLCLLRVFSTIRLSHFLFAFPTLCRRNSTFYRYYTFVVVHVLFLYVFWIFFSSPFFFLGTFWNIIPTVCIYSNGYNNARHFVYVNVNIHTELLIIITIIILVFGLKLQLLKRCLKDRQIYRGTQELHGKENDNFMQSKQSASEALKNVLL